MLSTLIAFGLGYVLGMQSSKEELEEIKEAALEIASSPQVQQLLAQGASLATEVAQSSFGGSR